MALKIGFTSLNLKVIKESLIIFDYILDIPDCAKYLLANEPLCQDLLENIALPLSN